MDSDGFASLVVILQFDLLRAWKDNIHNLMCKFSLLPDKAIGKAWKTCIELIYLKTVYCTFTISEYFVKHFVL